MWQRRWQWVARRRGRRVEMEGLSSDFQVRRWPGILLRISARRRRRLALIRNERLTWFLEWLQNLISTGQSSQLSNWGRRNSKFPKPLEISANSQYNSTQTPKTLPSSVPLSISTTITKSIENRLKWSIKRASFLAFSSLQPRTVQNNSWCQENPENESEKGKRIQGSI